MDVGQIKDNPLLLDYVNMSFVDEGKSVICEATCRKWSTTLPFSIGKRSLVGIDPGRNFGITLMQENYAQIIYGKMKKREPQWKYGLDAFDIARELTDYYYTGVVEGPIFRAEGQGKIYGEANLANIRFGFLLGMRENELNIDMVPPASSRKGAFDSAKLKGMDIWTTIDPNAAESLVLAIYLAKKKEWYTHGITGC